MTSSLLPWYARAWRAFVAGPRALLAVLAVRVAKWRLRRRVAKADPAYHRQASKVGKQLDAAAAARDPLVRRYKLVDKAGNARCVEGMPGMVALFLTVSGARARQRTGERIVPCLVPRSRLAETARKGTKRIIAHAILVALLAGCALESPTAPMSPAAPIDAARVAASATDDGTVPPPDGTPPGELVCSCVPDGWTWENGVLVQTYVIVCEPAPSPGNDQ